MKIPRTAHSGQPWRIHEFTGDFRTEDVWSFRAPGAGPDDFPVMLAAMQAAGGSAGQPRAVRFLFAVRGKLGAVGVIYSVWRRRRSCLKTGLQRAPAGSS